MELPPCQPARALLRLGRALLALPRPALLLLLLAWLAAIFLLSNTPAKTDSAHGVVRETLQNGGHAFLFGILALLLVPLLARAAEWIELGAGAALRLMLLVLAAGVLDEWHQSFVPGRSPSGYDLFTDLVGAASTLLVVRILCEGNFEALAARLRRALLGGILACTLAAILSTWLDV